MAHPFEVAPEEINALDDRQLQELVNRLVEIEIAQQGLPVDALVASDRIHDRDGGIDARIRAPGFDGGEFLPAGSSIWQAKAGKSGPDYRAELREGRVRLRRALQDGNTYVMVLGRQINDDQFETQSKNLQAALGEFAPNAFFELRSASQIAKWATKYPAVWHLLGRPPSPFWDVRDFLAQQELHDVEYCWSDATESLRDALRNQTVHPGSGEQLRVSGMTGVGKSRLVLEAFAEPSSVAVYAPYAEQLSVEVLTWMRDRPGLSVILVVDECNLSEAERLQTYASSAEGSLRLVTIGPDAPADRRNHFEVGPMTDDVIREVVAGVHPQITLDQREWIVDKARGFVKLARSLAVSARHSGIELSGLNVPDLLGEMFPAEERAALTVVSLLSHVGWDGEHDTEGKTLSRHMAIDWTTCRRLIQRMETRGYVGRTGRYRYVTPELLAIWFAAQEWSANRDGLLEIFSQAPPEMADRMSSRLRQMPHIDEVAELAREVLGPDGPFRTLAVLNHPRNARLFGDFSRVAPEAAIAALEAALHPLDANDLHSLDVGRREIVWTLERLVARRNLFPRAARLLLRLAVAENEYFVNSATGVFQSLFNPAARTSAATGDERLQLLAEVLRSTEERELLVAIGASKGVFGLHSAYAVSADPGGEPPPPAWTPESQEDRVDYCRQAFALLGTMLDHHSTPVRAAAESVLLERFRGLFWLGLGGEALRLANRADLSESIRRRLAAQSDDILAYDADRAFMSDDLMARLKDLRRAIFADPLRERLHLRLGSWNRDFYRASRESSENPFELEAREFEQLAADLLQQPEILRDEFKWITSEEAVRGRQFLTCLAEQDHQRQWLDIVLQASLAQNRPELIASYLFGRSLADDSAATEVLLDQWADNEELQHLVPPITAILGLTERRAVRLSALLDQGLDPRALLCLQHVHCDSDLNINTLTKMLRAMAGAGSPLTGTVWSMLNHLSSHNTEVGWTSDPSFLDLLWELVGSSEAIGDTRDTLARYSWSECAKPLVMSDPKRLATAIVEAVQLEREHLFAGSSVRGVLEACLLADPIGAWSVFAEAVEELSIGTWLLTNWAAEEGITEKVGVEALKLWVEQKAGQVERRIELIAKLTNVDTALSPVIRWLVEEHSASHKVLSNLELEKGMRVSWGGLAEMERPRLEAAREWMQDEHPAVRKWASRRVEELEQIVRRSREIDEESELKR